MWLCHVNRLRNFDVSMTGDINWMGVGMVSVKSGGRVITLLSPLPGQYNHTEPPILTAPKLPIVYSLTLGNKMQGEFIVGGRTHKRATT
jgi:hypothetical protein